MAILDMTPCEGSEAVPPLARSHTVLMAGQLADGQRALLRLSFGMGADGQVAMKVVARGDSPEASQALHAIIQEA